MKKMKKMSTVKEILCTALALAMLLGLEACGSSTGDSANSSTAPTEDAGSLTELDVVLDWYPNAVHTFLYAAQDQGYFAEEGLKVNLISPADSVDALNFVASGRAELGISYPIDLLQAVADEDMPVRAIGAVSQEPLDRLVSMHSSGITADMSTLRGKKVAYDGIAISEAAVRTVARSAGLADSDYEMVNVGFDLVTSLTTGSVDIASGMFINDEVVTMRLAGYDIDVWSLQDYGMPSYYGMIFVANSDAYAENPAVYEAFLRACNKGFAYMKADEEKAMEIIMNEMNSEDNPLDEEQQKQSYETLLPLMETENGPFLTMKEETWQTLIDWMLENKLIAKSVTPADVETSPTLG